jgi:hypothetical protein
MLIGLHPDNRLVSDFESIIYTLRPINNHEHCIYITGVSRCEGERPIADYLAMGIMIDYGLKLVIHKHIKLRKNHELFKQDEGKS